MTLAADCAAARATGTKISRSPRVSSAARHRKPILAFYDFVRTADDIADHPRCRRPRSSRCSTPGGDPARQERRRAGRRRAARGCNERGLIPQHAQDLLTAFRLDVTKLRYRDWDDLIDYCRYSAMPVGRFVLDVHGEAARTWPANDALCAALQIINHLQDCGEDYRNLDRVYVPLDALAAHGAASRSWERRGQPAAARLPARLAARTGRLLRAEPGPVPADRRLAAGAGGRGHPAPGRAADRACCCTHDPLTERVHLSKPAMCAPARRRRARPAAASVHAAPRMAAAGAGVMP